MLDSIAASTMIVNSSASESILESVPHDFQAQRDKIADGSYGQQYVPDTEF